MATAVESRSRRSSVTPGGMFNISSTQAIDQTDIRHLTSTFLKNSMHVIEGSPVLQTNAALRQMVAYCTSVMCKNEEHLNEKRVKEAEAKAATLVESGLASSDDVKARRQSKRPSMARTNFLNAVLKDQSILPNGLPSETEMEFAYSLITQIYILIPRSKNPLECEIIDVDSLMELYNWYKRAIVSMKKIEEGLASCKSPTLLTGFASMLSGGPKSGLAHNTSPPLNILISLKEHDTHDHRAWLPNEVSDAIACILECRWRDVDLGIPVPAGTLPAPSSLLSPVVATVLPSQLSLASHTVSFFRRVYCSSASVCLERLRNFSSGVLAHQNSAEFGTRISTFAYLVGLLRGDHDVDRLATHPQCGLFFLKVLGTFCKGQNLGEALRTDDRRTLVPCLTGDDAISFRTTLRSLFSGLPQTNTNSGSALNNFLLDVEGKCLRIGKRPFVDVDWLSMKCVTYWCKVYGGAHWAAVDSLTQRPRSPPNADKRRFAKTKQKQGEADVLTLRDAGGKGLAKTRIDEEEEGTLGESRKKELDLCLKTFAITKAGAMMKHYVAKIRELIRVRRITSNQFGEEEEGEEEEQLPQYPPVQEFESVEELAWLSKTQKKKTLPVIAYETENLTLACVPSRDKETGEEVCFEEMRAIINARNRLRSLSLLLRTRLNMAYTVRAAPLDLVRDVVARVKLAVENPGKTYVLSHDGYGLRDDVQIIKYDIKNNACLRIYEKREWDEFCSIRRSVGGTDKDVLPHKYARPMHEHFVVPRMISAHTGGGGRSGGNAIIFADDFPLDENDDDGNDA